MKRKATNLFDRLLAAKNGFIPDIRIVLLLNNVGAAILESGKRNF
jgi:hypothetical protein